MAKRQQLLFAYKYHLHRQSEKIYKSLGLMSVGSSPQSHYQSWYVYRYPLFVSFLLLWASMPLQVAQDRDFPGCRIFHAKNETVTLVLTWIFFSHNPWIFAFKLGYVFKFVLYYSLSSISRYFQHRVWICISSSLLLPEFPLLSL